MSRERRREIKNDTKRGFKDGEEKWWREERGTRGGVSLVNMSACRH